MGISYLTQRGGDKYKLFKRSINHTISGYISSIKLNGITKIRVSAFYNCTSLTSIDLPDSLTTIGNRAFSYCTSLTNISIPDSLTTIGDTAFSYCTSLTNISIPDSLTTIGDTAFYNCTSLTSIDLPNNVTSINYQAFSGCSSLTSVILRASAPPTLGYSAFYNTNDNLIIYVPAESVDTYKSASRWSSYADIIQAIPED